MIQEAPVVQAAVLVHGRVVRECKDTTITFESLMAGELLSAPLAHMPASKCYRVVVCHKQYQPGCSKRTSIVNLLMFFCPFKDKFVSMLGGQDANLHVSLNTLSDITFKNRLCLSMLQGSHSEMVQPGTAPPQPLRLALQHT